MEILRQADQVSAYIQAHPESEISTLIQQRLSELLTDEDTNLEDVVVFLILRDGDMLSDLEEVLGSPVQTTTGHPLWELIESHATCQEMVFVLSSSGFGAVVLVPHLDAPQELLDLCRRYALPESGSA